MDTHPELCDGIGVDGVERDQNGELLSGAAIS